MVLVEQVRSAIIFGGSGFIGGHLIDRLANAGARVVVADLVRPRSLPTGVKFVQVDVRKPVVDVEAPSPDVAFNLAAVHRTPGHPENEYYDTNVAGALNVSAWCDQVGVNRLVFTSSISVYGATEEKKDEDSALVPNTSYGRSKLLAESIHRTWANSAAGRQLIIARPAVIFGPGEGGNFSRLAGALRRRRFFYPGRTDTIKACGYVDDLVSALLFGLANEQPEFTFNFGYPDLYSIEDICEAFHAVAGYQRPKLLPPALMRLALAALSGFDARPNSSLNPERVRKLTQSTTIAPTALMQAGFCWDTDLASALKDWRAKSHNGEFV